MRKIARTIQDKLLLNIKNSPIVFVNGPRQAGKSTLVQMIAEDKHKANYVTFDNITEMAAATNNPSSYLKLKPTPIIIDEVQLVPEIFRNLKIIVDENRLQNPKDTNGQFILTGSANILALPKLADALVGRMNVLTLYPLSVSEVLKTRSHFIDNLFNKNINNKISNFIDIDKAISIATFPEISGKDQQSQVIWFENYLATLLQRDVRTLAEIEKTSILPNLLRVLATRAGSLINEANIASSIKINAVTEKNYRSILKMMFLTHDIKPWLKNIGKRLVKAPKGYITDTSLLCHLLGYDYKTLQTKRPELLGHVIENFVASELLKLISFSSSREKLMFFRTSDGKEVDFILERPNADLIALEIKASDHVSKSDFKGLKELKSHAKEHFITGAVLYQGKDIVPFDDDLWALPIDFLWN